MAGAPAADLLVGGVRRVAARVADGGGEHARRLPEDALGAPEAAHADDQLLGVVGEGRLERRAEHEVAVGHMEGARVAARERVSRVGHVGLVTEEEAHTIETSVTVRGMAQVTELDLPGARLLRRRPHGRALPPRHGRAEPAPAGSRASPIGYFVLDREAAAFFLRTRAATFPGMKIAEMFEVPEGPLLEQMRRNILHINGDDHRRLRNLVNPAFTPRAADRWRPAMREFLERLWEPLADAGRCEFVDAFAKPYPSLTIATVMGAPLDGRAEAARVVEPDPAPVRRAQPDARARGDRARLRGVLRVGRRADRAAQGRPRRRPDLDADRRRAGGRPALRRRVHEPRAERARRRRRHDPVAARPRHAPVRRAPRPVAAAGRATRSWRPRPSRRWCATSRSPRSPRGCCTRRSSTAT